MLYIIFLYILSVALTLATLATPNNNINKTDHTNPLTKTSDQSSSAVRRFISQKKRSRRLTLTSSLRFAILEEVQGLTVVEKCVLMC